MGVEAGARDLMAQDLVPQNLVAQNTAAQDAVALDTAAQDTDARDTAARDMPGGASAPRQTWCPSAGPERPESVVLGVQSPEHGQVSYLAEPIPAAEAVAMLPEGVDPRRVLRFAAHCTRQCPNNSAGDCTLVERMQAIPVGADQGQGVPRCHLRQDCQWWTQVGVEACRRCPALVTSRTAGHEFHEFVADPRTTRAELEAWIAANPTASLAVGA